MSYSRFVICYPAQSGCPALVARGPSGSTKKPARALPADCLKLEHMLNEECRMQHDRFCDCYSLTPAEIELTSKTAPPRTPIPPPAT
jgi:hypothetical protein